ncbi:MAG: 1-(5-phosphoribosyl)-5-[(5-phosphoribosylamino)methylideneamino]imidazole-4-carboxamide isomerase [Clostridia bacterium]|nr:1-(5-phosphoribosyl)-5-[(5-phosphoribosylamino)methylideneamino]imidazole-4-carboxamide isomerase [Clostridia bacterium]
MLIIPAIDLHEGEVVRLYQGDYAQKTVYSQDPAAMAGHFVKMGAKYLHIVDLDGAKKGGAVNAEIIRKIRMSVNVPLQVGGGIRDAETVAQYLQEIRADRVILGTVAVKNIGFVEECIAKYTPERIVVSVDVKDGHVATEGWLRDSGMDCFRFIEQLKGVGVGYIIVTDISKDGTLSSPNWAMYQKIEGIRVMVSGGVACEADFRKAAGYYGVIVGKAYYEGKVDLEKCLQRESSPVWIS